jgi:hypothetical protein
MEESIPPRGFVPQNFYGAQPFVSHQAYSNQRTGNPSTLWTPDAKSKNQQKKNVALKLPARERKPLEIKDKDGNPLVFVSKQASTTADTVAQDSAEDAQTKKDDPVKSDANGNENKVEVEKSSVVEVLK